MKGESNTQPVDFVKSNGKTQCNYNILSVQKTDPMTEIIRTVYEYEYVEVEGDVTKNKFIEELDKEKDKKDTTPWTPTAEYDKWKV